MPTSAFRRVLRPLLPYSQAGSTLPFRTRLIGTSTGNYDPLRILFCGADEFSIHSLRALHELQQEKPDSIASIDVVCRPDKRTGREMKNLRQVPIKPVAQSLDLPLHQIDTFTGWTPPAPIDLVVAVSFGLLVPGRILKSARYGGLNVHPSLLPDLRGSAPLQYALMLGRKKTGVSLQTMHPTKFDHGTVLSQQSIDIPDECSLEQLVETTGRMGASILRDAVENATFVGPGVVTPTENTEQIELVHAPKITKEDAHIDWQTWTSDKVRQYGRVLELWDDTTHAACYSAKPARVKYQGPWSKMSASELSNEGISHAVTGATPKPGRPIAYRQHGQKGWRLAICAADGELVSPSSASIEGKKEGGGVQALTQALKRSAGV